MAGQRTQLILGDVKAKVSLAKTSAESAGPRWENVTLDLATGRPIVESTAEEIGDEQVLIGGPAEAEIVTDTSDDLNSPEARRSRGLEPIAPATGARHTGGVRDLAAPVPVIPQTPQQALERDEAAGFEPTTKLARGVYTEGGEFVDLTDLLVDIDEHVKLEGLTVAKSIDANSVPRDRVRGSFYVEPQGDTKAELALATRVRDLLWTVLSDERRALVVRWTKRTNQALGIVVASKAYGALVLLEVEWGPNMRKPSKKAQVTADFKPSDAERAAALDYLKRTAAPASSIDTIADERRVLQADAIKLAKEKGEVLELPERHSDDEALAAALTA